MSEPVVFVNVFTLHCTNAEFERVFAETAAFMHTRSGFVGHRLVRSTTRPDRYVNVAEWQSAEAFHHTVASPDFQPHAQALRALAVSESHVCETVIQA